jgi:hypothetical protein
MLLVLALMGTPGRAVSDSQELNSLFDEACDLYEESEFEGALRILESLTSDGVRDAAVYYNLGNCYYQMGEVGKAVVNYRRAHVLAPRDENTEANLAFLRASVGFRDTTEWFDIAKVTGLPGEIASPREWQVFFFVAYYLSAACLLAVLFVGGTVRRYAVRVMGILIVLAIASWVFADQGLSRFSASREGAVIVDRSEFMSGPGAAFDELARLPDGVEITLVARSGIWVEVRLPTGEIGWLKETDIETI